MKLDFLSLDTLEVLFVEEVFMTSFNDFVEPDPQSGSAEGYGGEVEGPDGT